MQMIKALWQRSLLRRLLLLQTTACLGVLATLCIVFGSLMDVQVPAEGERMAKQLASMLIELGDPANSAPRFLRRLVLSLEHDDPLRQMVKNPTQPPWLRFEILDGSGKVLAASAQPLSATPEGWSSYTLRDELNGRSVRVAIDAFAVYLVWRADVLRLLTKVALVTALVIVPGVMISSVLLARLGLSPLRQLGETIASRSSDNLSAVTMSRRYSELSPLLVELNRLLGKLRHSRQIERQLFADAAHELLTPVAALRAQVHLVATASDADAKASAQYELDAGLQRMTSLIRQLLLSARLDSERMRLDKRSNDLSKLARERITAIAVRALDKAIDLSLESAEACIGMFDRDTFATVLDNVLDNAIRHTPAGGRIVVKVRRRGSSMVMAIADDGSGIPQSYRRQVLERFFRVPGNQEAGSGLGLAIVARVVTLHGGAVRVSRGLGSRGTAVILRVPAHARDVCMAGGESGAMASPVPIDLRASSVQLSSASLKGV